MTDTATTHYGWIMPGDHVNSNTWGGLTNGNWAGVDATVYGISQTVTTLSGQLTPNNLYVSRAATVPGSISFINSTAPVGQQQRWEFVESALTESGSNNGSNFTLNSFSDTGSLLRADWYITRANGNMTFTGNATFSATLACTSSFAVNAISTSDNAFVGFFNSAGVRQGFVGWINASNFLDIQSDIGGASINVGSSIALNGAVTGSSSAIFSGGLQGTGLSLAAASGADSTINLASGGTARGELLWQASTNYVVMYHASSGLNAYLDSLGQFNITSPNAIKPGGGTWAAPSDIRIKNVVEDYTAGLSEVLQLNPVVYTYKGNDTPAPGEPSPHKHAAETGKQFVGFIAQELEEVFPDMVSLHEGCIDGEKVTDLRDVDVSSLIYALCNSVRQLKAEIEELKAR